ncbi:MULTISPECIES: hypothetical protein [Streptomyces]|uniref:hypothetical protein n=1 Tax=Streptomyces TaxID=1883 RepID=UPI0007C837A5|nr:MULTISPECIES: hypothetical protein [Streptomyces]MDF6061646.1 hypothetical protein [Streptomyces sp. JH010]WSK31263.1 hypothetical protein OG483_26690 [[Kitasatospora] papulosa]
MSTGVIALLVAVVGVAGTLLAPVTTAWVSSRSRRQEFELQQRSEQAKRHIDDAQANLERRRDIYVALNSGARRYRFQMMEDLYALRDGADPDPATETVRVDFQDTYAQAQMLVPDSVLQPCQAVRVALADARKLMESLSAGGAHDQQRWQETHTFLIRMWDAITAMQLAMRQDLGISAA